MAMNFGGNWAMLGAGMGAGLGKGINERVSNTLDLLAQKKLWDMQNVAQRQYQQQQISDLAKLLEPIYKEQAPSYAALAITQPSIAEGLMENYAATHPQAQVSQAGIQTVAQPLPMPQQYRTQYMPQGSIEDKLLQLAGLGQRPDYLGSTADKLVALQAATRPELQGQGFLTPPRAVQTPISQPQIAPQPGQVQPTAQRPGITPQAVGQQAQQPLTEAEAVARGFTKPSTAHQLEMESQGREKQKRAVQKDIRPFLNAEEADLTNNIHVRELAEQALDILEKHGDEFPSRIWGLAPIEMQQYFNSDTPVGQFLDITGDLVVAKSMALKGQPTNFKIKLVQSIKPTLSKNIETNKANLRRIIEYGDKAEMASNYLSTLKDNEGNYPADVKERYIEYTKALHKPLNYPQQFPVGTHYVDDEDKEFEVYQKGNEKKWRPIHG